jgi:hypothetical protein
MDEAWVENRFAMITYSNCNSRGEKRQLALLHDPMLMFEIHLVARVNLVL